jgi:hypothetical protein
MLWQSIKESQAYTQKLVDRWQLPTPNFKIGDHVFVKAEYFQTTQLTKKLAEKYLGPFEIIAQAGTHSFTLRLPNSMQVPNRLLCC